MFSILHRGSCSPNVDQGGCRTHSVSALLLVDDFALANFEKRHRYYSSNSVLKLTSLSVMQCSLRFRQCIMYGIKKRRLVGLQYTSTASRLMQIIRSARSTQLSLTTPVTETFGKKSVRFQIQTSVTLTIHCLFHTPKPDKIKLESVLSAQALESFTSRGNE